MEEEYFTIQQVAERFQVTRAAVYNWMRAGELGFVYVGKDRRIPGSAVRAFVRPGRASEVPGEDSQTGKSTPALALA